MKRRFSTALIATGLVISMCGTTLAAGRALSYGTSGDDVYSLQETLAYYGYFYDEPTGYYGEITQAAVMSFQSDYGLDVDGVAGPITTNFLGLTTNSESGDSYVPYSNGYSYDESSLSGALYYGMEGNDVYTLQVLLADYGYFVSVATGYFGELTEAALINFQSDYGLSVDGVAGSETFGALLGTSYDSDDSSSISYEDYAEAVINAVYSTPATASGYCAAWVTQVIKNAGVLSYNINNLRPTYYSYAVTSGLADSWYSDNTGFNANDYWAYVCYSNDINELAPGMIIATRSTNTYLGRQFGHVGIYIGNGQVVSSIGYLETLSLDDWIARYNNESMGSTVYWGYLPQ